MIKGINHIAVASKDIDIAREFFETLLGLNRVGRETIDDQRITTDFYHAENTTIEVMEPTAEDSPISNFLEESGEGLHHICFDVANIEEMLTRLQQAGIQLIDDTPRTGARGSKIAFLHPKSTHGILIELHESPEADSGNNSSEEHSEE